MKNEITRGETSMSGENNGRGQNLKAINLIRSNKVFVEIEIKQWHLSTVQIN